ncbi:hypothetical protein SAMN05444365_105194 [Micromonospora pattaloongensis]|uniref:Cell division protein FtsB n=1 Tax=Micromonospora pattaloongensis TaxID=405436 RepID=A0A1H3Q2I4_9ACTN|nr:hypothetical protein [Micromonospora pattaloongensis]SDZ07607.1 hypothetical protein SAMN05444365_105194 [Micromonospora pattaloongensis]
MNIEKRDRRHDVGVRAAGQRTPRSGGRTVAQRATRGSTLAAAQTARDARARGAREYPTQGSAALQPQESLQVWDSSAEEAGAATTARSASAPRLKVAPPLPVAVPRAPFVALVLVVVVGGVLGILMVNTKINENAFRLGTLKEQQASLDIRQQQLENEIAQHEAPGNLAAQARKLGLVESGPPAFIRLPDGRVIGVPQPATGRPSAASQPDAGR